MLGAQHGLLQADSMENQGPQQAQTGDSARLFHFPGAGQSDPNPPDRGQHPGDAARSAHGAAGSRRGAARRARVHRPREGQGAGRRSRRQPQPRPGPGGRRPQGTDRLDGRRPGRGFQRIVAGRAAARRHPDGWLAGRG
ncbi:hypothetical protein G6F50_014828 [Rhizopus delemar]|uniref:Uncharacterized protein n=1 Tax=Rhizopus delemar TaxID=936053 RepID=A0A9P6Y217_9FUNG|nr:hypothetical protein G6F50_014828 [Rhizopus delemar]